MEKELLEKEILKEIKKRYRPGDLVSDCFGNTCVLEDPYNDYAYNNNVFETYYNSNLMINNIVDTTYFNTVLFYKGKWALNLTKHTYRKIYK